MKYKFFITILLALFLSSQLFAEAKERSPNFIEKFFIEKFGKEEDKKHVYEQENNAKAEEKIYKTNGKFYQRIRRLFKKTKRNFYLIINYLKLF